LKVKLNSQTSGIQSTKKFGTCARLQMNEDPIGSDFDDFQAEEGLLEEAEAAAAKRVLRFRSKK
jgi:hypothetical protein